MHEVLPGEETSKRLILVEHDPELNRVLDAILRANRYQVLTLSNGSALVETTQSYRPDCVILDISLPDGTGLDLLQALAAEQPELPIVAISSTGTIEMAVDAIKMGAADFVEPFHLDNLVSHVAKLIAQPRLRRHEQPAQVSSAYSAGLRLLTGREHEVLVQLARGASSKEAGRCLGISPRTVDVHRARIKEKLHVRRVVDLVRLVYETDSLTPDNKSQATR
jgi:FixJ family two-component response regulator